MTRPFEFAHGEYYHIYNRGTDKRKIFLDNHDRERFISLLFLCNSGIPLHRSDRGDTSLQKILETPRETTLVDIGAYCLMPNHFHILVHEQTEGGISLFMQKLATAYTMYFNKRNDRKGSLFEGTFRAKHASDDDYLKYLFAYIHLNPIGTIEDGWKTHHIKNKKKAEEFLASYPYSSYLDYARSTNERPEGVIINKLAFPEYFEKATDFKDYVNDWMTNEEILAN
jgi:putative transposase